LCRRAEALGFHSAWTADTAGGDAFVDAAFAIAATCTLPVGIGVALPSRSPLQTASAAAALAAGNRRIYLGLGAGNRRTNELGHGIPYSPVAERMREFVACTTGVLRASPGQPFELDGRYYRVAGAGLGIGTDLVSVVLGAHGQLMSRLAGETGDGLIVHLLTPRSTIEQRIDLARSVYKGHSFLGAAGILMSAHSNEATALSRARTVLERVFTVPRFGARLAEMQPRADPAHLAEEVVRQFVLVTTPARLQAEVADFREAELLIPVPISVFMPPSTDAEDARLAVLAGLYHDSSGGGARGRA
jgi:alkanesulfonate monooxygenase SsuD/methylene tetrahydromethanopterin reductase-like flavin-dependent oxidoreductase (luciferase family)